MSYKVKFKSKTAVDGLSTVSCWCYEIEATGNDSIDNAQWGLDFPNNIKFEDPDHYDECNEYSVDTVSMEGKTVIHKSQSSGTPRESMQICFIASSEEATGTEISLERATSESVPSGVWNWEDKQIEGSGKVVGPKAVAEFPIEKEIDDITDALAKYEATKFGYLLSSVRAKIC